MSSSTEDERNLIQSLVDGDESAFKLIFKNYKNRLYCFSLRFTKSEELAEEIVQDVFLKIWLNRKKINPDKSFSAYLFKISKNLCLNFLKKAQLDLLIKKELIANVERADNYTDNFVMSCENELLLEKAIRRLPHQQQIVFVMCRIDGLSHKEIAEKLHLSKGTIKNYMMLAVNNVTQFLHINADKVFLIAYLYLV